LKKCETENCIEQVEDNDLSGTCDLCLMDEGRSKIYDCDECGEQFDGIIDLGNHWDDVHKGKIDG